MKKALLLIDLQNDSRTLFNTLNTNKSFETIFKSARKFSLPK